MKKPMYFCDICNADLSRKPGVGFKHESDHNDATTSHSGKMEECKVHLCDYCMGIIKHYISSGR